MGVVKSWLPPELAVSQPYTMSALMGCSTDRTRPCAQPHVLPSMGTSVRMDDARTCGPYMPGNVMMILGAFIAPARVQHEAQKAGERAIMMQHPRGLLEKLGLVREQEPEISPAAHAAIDQGNAATDAFLDALHALEDED